MNEMNFVSFMNSLASYLNFSNISDSSKSGKEDPQNNYGGDTHQTLSLETQKISAHLIENEVNKKLISLYKTLRKGIAPTHEIARKNTFLNQLIEGGNAFCSKAYVHYLCNLYVIHEAIESAQNQLTELKGNNFFVFPLLFRSEKLLNDIKVWSIFNTTAPLFASLDIQSSEFIMNIQSLSRPSTKKFVEHIETIRRENIVLIIGTLFSIYGTLMSGGQFVKKGIEEGFRVRMDEADDILDKEEISLRKEFLQNIEAERDPVSYAATLFSFDEDIEAFKERWHKNLDEVGQNLEFGSIQERENFESKVIEEANFAVNTVLSSIEEILVFLRENKE